MLPKIRPNSNLFILCALVMLAGAVRLIGLAQVPPGLHFDEAFHEVEAVEILKGVTPIYFTENMGMDPMHIYLIAALFKLIGVTHIGGRLVSALAGTLTVPALWWLVHELYAGQKGKSALAGASAFTLTTCQWHLTMSRTGIQPVLVPLLLTLTLAALWRGLRTGRARWFVTAGVCLGLGPYAYSSARVTPLLILFILLWLLLFDRPLLRRRWWGLGLSVAVALAVFAPLGTYFITHWQQFTYRSAQVTYYTLGAGSENPLKVLGQNLIKTLAALNFKGDLEPIRNLPGRPALDVFQSALFWIGVGVCVRHIRRPEYAVLPAWLGVMLLPTILTEFAPHFGRALGATPAVAMLVAVGAVEVWQALRRIVPQTVPLARSLMATLIIGLLAGGLNHLYNYFVRWAQLPILERAYEVGLLEAARTVRARVPNAQVYLSPIQMGHPILRFITWDRPGAKSYDGRYAQVLPYTDERPADFVIVPYLDDKSPARLRHIYPAGQIIASGGHYEGAPYYQVFHVPAASRPHLVPQHPVEVTWADGLRLIGYDQDKPACRPGDSLTLTMYWQSTATTQVAYTVFVHLLGEINPQSGSPLWAGSDHEPGLASYPTSAWAVGEVIMDEFVLHLPADMPAGNYQVEVGFYRLANMQRLAITQSSVQARADAALIGLITITD